MMKLSDENNRWVLNTDLNNLTVNERKDALVLLYFYNTYEDEIRAFKELKSSWVDNIYKLPKTSAIEYASVKNGRYNILNKMKMIKEKYMVEVQP